MVVSGLEEAFPVKADKAPNFEPISKPANFVFAIRTGPAITRVSRGPLIARSAAQCSTFQLRSGRKHYAKGWEHRFQFIDRHVRGAEFEVHHLLLTLGLKSAGELSD